MKPKLSKLVTIPATKGSHKGIVKTIKIIAAISSILNSDKKTPRSSRIICNTQRWNLLGQAGGVPQKWGLFLGLNFGQ